MHAPRQNGNNGCVAPAHTLAGAPPLGDADGEALSDVALVSLRTVAELESRPTRTPDFAADNRALVALAQAMAATPRGILQKLSEIALDLCQAQTAGISLLEEDGRHFYWPAIVGQWECFIGGGTPRDYGPCGTVLDRDCPLFCTHPERDFDYLIPVKPQIEEALLLPFYLEGKAVGTLWVIMHDTSRRFDAEDLRILTSLATFTSAAYQVWQASADASDRLAAAVTARQDTDMLNAQLRSEISEREKSQALLEAQKRLLEKVAGSAPLSEVFAALTDSVTVLQPEARAAVMLAAGTRDKMGPVFSTTIPASFGEKITGLPIDDTCIGTCSAAIYQGETMTCRDIATAPRWSQPWRDLCAAHGVQACHSTPAFDAEGRAVASFVLTFAAPHEPDAWERQLGEFGASVVGVVLARDRAREEHFRALTLATNDVVYRMSPDWRSMWHLAGKDFIPSTTGASDSWLDTYIHPDDRPGVVATIQAAIRDKHPFEMEHRVIRVDGTLGWAFSRAVPLYDELGEISEWFGAASDVTERKHAEDVLRESEEFNRSLMRSSPDCVKVLDLAGRLLLMNERGICQMEIDDFSAQCAGRGWWDLWPAEATETIQRALDTARGGVSFSFEAFCPTAKGAPKWWEVSANPVSDSSGKVVRLLAISRDITERKLIEEALRNSEERFRDMADNIASLAWICDTLGNVIWYNRRWLDYTGLDFAAMEGWGWKQMHHPEHVDRVVATVEHSAATGESWEDTFPLRDAEGNYRWFLSRAVPIRDAEGKVLRWFGTNTDVTELRVAQEGLRLAKEEAEAANRAKDNFLAALSHELRTPLTPVLMTAAALREDERLPADMREQLGMIERNVTIEGVLIDDLLDLTRISRGKLELRPQRCDAHSLIALAVEIVRDDAQAKGIAIEQALAAEKCGLTADPARFQQVIWNLLRNAVKFTPRDGRIAIKTSCADGQLRIEVSDSGIGIPAEDLKKIFAPFEQAEATGEHRFGGLGLGLAIARAIVEMHGGGIHAESAGVGRGATFYVELPGATESPLHEKIAGDQDFVTPQADGPPLHLLLVEDHVPTLNVLKRLLTRAGHRVTTASTAAEALAAASRERPDLVISDLGLPDGAGTELMAQLRDEHGLTGIALTGYGMEDDLARTRAAGFITHLVKPIRFDQLRRALSEGRSQIVHRS